MVGGDGGTGGAAGGVGGRGGDGGGGGEGALLGDGSTLSVNPAGNGFGASTVTGGNGAAGGGANGGTAGAQGSGGAGVLGSNLTIFNGGTIAGGTGSTAGNAITLTAGISTLHLSNGGTTGTITGDIAVTGSLTIDPATTTATLGNVIKDGIGGAGSNAINSSSQTLVVSGANTYTGGTNFRAGILRVGSAGALGSTGTLSFMGGTLQYSGANTTDYSGRFSTAANQAYSIDTNSQNVTFATSLTSAGGTLTKINAGKLTLTAAETYTGATTITGGTLALSGAGSIASSSGVLNSSAFDISQVTGVGTSLATYAGAGTTALGGKSLTIADGGDHTLDGVISGAGGSITLMAGTLTLTAANTYSGGTTVDGGARINLKNNTAAGTGAIALLSGSSLGLDAVTITNAVTVAGDPDIFVTGASSMPTYTGPAGTITNILGTDNSATTDVLTLTTANATYAGTTNVGGTATGSAVTLKGGAANAFGSTSTVNVFTGSILNLGGFNQSIGSLAGGGGVTLGADTLTVTAATGTFSGTLGATGDTGGFTVSGGTETLSGTNLYTGATTLNGGTLALTGTGSISDSSAVDLATGSTFDISGHTGGVSIVTLGNTAAGQTGTVTLGANTLTLSNASTTFGGVIQGTGGLTLTAGTETLTGANTYTGATTLNGGTLDLTSTGSIADSSAVDLATGSTFDISGHTGGTSIVTLGNTAAGQTGTVTLGANTLTLSNASTSFGGVIQGTGGLTHTAGTETLTGANAYTGATTLNGGTLALTGSLANTAMTINTGATLAGAGNGTTTGITAGSVTVAGGGTIEPGLPGAGNFGLLTVGSLVLTNTAGGSNVDLDLATPNVAGGATNDLLKDNGALTLAGNITVTPGLGAGAYRLINFGGALTNNGATVINAPAGSVLQAGGAAGNGQVNLLVAGANGIVQYWNGNAGAFDGIHPNGNGGNGTWNATNFNWTDSGNTFEEQWASGTGIFAGTAGTVNLTAALSFQELEFQTSGYTIAAGGGSLTSTGISTVLVDGGTATINVPINGTQFVKDGAGVLVLGGTSTFGGGAVSINNGTLEIGGGAGSIAAGTLVNAGAAIFQVDSGSTASFTTSASNSGIMNIAGTLNAGTNGLTNFAGAVVNAGAAPPAAAAAVNGPIANAGTFNVVGVAASDGTFDNQAGAALNVGVGGAAGNYTIAQLLTNTASVTITAGSTLTDTAGGVTNTSTGTITNNGTVNDVLNNAGQVTNNGIYNATVQTNSGEIDNFAAWNGDVLSNTGTINNGGTWTTLAVGFTTSGTLDTTGVLNATAGGLNNTGTVNARGTINGPIANNAGFFNLSGNLIGDNTFTNAGPATLNVGGNIYSGATTLDNFGTVNLSGGAIATTVGVINENGSVFNSNGGTITSPTFTNAGRLSMANGVVGDVTRINGNYVATGANATLAVDVDLRNTAPRITDQLVVTGTVAGNTLVDFSRSLKGGSQINPNIPTFVGGTLIPTTPIVISNGGTGTFTPAQGSGNVFATNGGLVQYQLQQTSPGNYSIVSGANTGAITPIATSLSSAFGAISTSFFQSSSAFVVPASGNGPDQFTYGPWIRISGGSADIDSTGSDTQLGQTSKSLVDTTFEGFQAGFDSGLINVDKTNTNFHIGLTTGIVGADATEKKASSTDVNFSIPFVGVYGAVKHNDFSADVTYRHDFVDLRVAGGAVPKPTHIPADGNSVYGNLLYGIAAGKFSIIPSLGLGYSHYDIGNLPTVLGGSIGFRNFDSVLGRLGVQVGRTVAVTDKFAVQPFVTGAVWHEFEGNTVARFSDPSGLFDQINTTRVGTFGQVGVGVSAQLVPVGFTAFLRGDFRFGDKLNGQVGTLGVRYSF